MPAHPPQVERPAQACGQRGAADAGVAARAEDGEPVQGEADVGGTDWEGLGVVADPARRIRLDASAVEGDRRRVVGVVDGDHRKPVTGEVLHDAGAERP